MTTFHTDGLGWCGKTRFPVISILGSNGKRQLLMLIVSRNVSGHERVTLRESS